MLDKITQPPVVITPEELKSVVAVLHGYRALSRHKDKKENYIAMRVKI